MTEAYAVKEARGDINPRTVSPQAKGSKRRWLNLQHGVDISRLKDADAEAAFEAFKREHNQQLVRVEIREIG